jgi:preprotein translocase subunit SecB
MAEPLKFRPLAFGATGVRLDIDFNALAQPEAEFEQVFNLNYRPYAINQTEAQGWALQFDLELRLHYLHLHMQYYAWYEAAGDLPDDLVGNDFVMVNAPAIAYPYLRAYVSQMTVLSGIPSVYLPVVNFVELAQAMRKQLDTRPMDGA